MLDTNTPRELFLRKSSGLVRSARPLDVFVYNLGLISIGIAISLTQSLGAPYYPGANAALACVIAGILMTAIALGFWFWTTAIPRSGGVYAFLSRSTSPGFGFALSFVDAFTWLFYNSLAAKLISAVGLGPLFLSLYRITGVEWYLRMASAFSTPATQFVVGLVAIGIATIILLAGIRVFFFAQKIIFALAFIGTLAIFAAVVTTDTAVFQEDYSHFAKEHDLPSYAEVQQGITTTTNFSLTATIGLAMWPFLSFVGSIFSVAIGGEVQDVRRSQGIGMFGSILFAVVVLTVLLTLSTQAYGEKFLSAVWLNEATANYAIGFYLPTLVCIGSSPWLGILSAIGFIAWAFFWLPATFVYSGRSLLAWSLDRLAPASFGFVHDRLHTPVTSILVVSLANVVMLALFLFTGFFGTLILVLAAMFAWLPTMAAGIVFPWFRKSLYEKSAAAKFTIAGVPAMSIACSLAFGCTAVVTYLLWNDPIAAGHDWKSLTTIGVTFGVGVVWYLITIYRRKRQGFNVRALFEEIPVE